MARGWVSRKRSKEDKGDFGREIAPKITIGKTPQMERCHLRNDERSSYKLRGGRVRTDVKRSSFGTPRNHEDQKKGNGNRDWHKRCNSPLQDVGGNRRK